MKKKIVSAEETILKVARQIFTQKGLSGARMQDIADEAGINKALVHYYFGTKGKLFALIFEQEFGKFFSNLAAVISADIPLFEKIEQVVLMDIERLGQFPDLPLFIINEVSHNPEMMSKRFRKMNVPEVMGNFQRQIDAEIAKGAIRPVSATELLVNIQSLSIFPFIAKPMMRNVLRLTEKQYQAMMQARKKSVATFIINALKLPG